MFIVTFIDDGFDVQVISKVETMEAAIAAAKADISKVMEYVKKDTPDVILETNENSFILSSEVSNDLIAVWKIHKI